MFHAIGDDGRRGLRGISGLASPAAKSRRAPRCAASPKARLASPRNRKSPQKSPGRSPRKLPAARQSPARVAAACGDAALDTSATTWPLPLAVTWPLVLSSASWLGVWRYTLSVAGADPVMGWLARTILLTALLSCVHWADAHNGWRNLADRVMARASFVGFTVVAVARVRDARLHVAGWPLWLLMCACYVMSRRLGPIRDAAPAERETARNHTRSPWRLEPWVVAHACFHACVGIGQLVIVHGASAPSAERKWM